MSEQKKLFREKSLEQFSSPEQLNEYIHVTSPSIFMMLGAVIAILIGTVIWGLTGTISTHTAVSAVCNDGNLTAYIDSQYAADLSADSVIEVNGTEYAITAVTNQARAGEILKAEELPKYGISANSLVIGVSASTSLADGVYEATVIMMKMRPADLIIY